MAKRGARLAVLLVMGVFALGLLAGCAGQPDPEATRGSVAVPEATQQEQTAALKVAEGVVRQEGELKVSGEGFSPGEMVVLAASREATGPTEEIGRLRADKEGHLPEDEVSLPDWLTSGPHQLEASGETSGAKAETTLYVRAKDLWILLDRYDPQPLDRLGFIAGGFEPGEGVRVYFQEAPERTLSQLSTDPSGNVEWSEAEVPLLPGGDYRLVLEGEDSALQITSDLVVRPFAPIFELTSYAGPLGSSTSMTGEGFVPGETVRFYLSGQQEPASVITADEYGKFYWAGEFDFPYEMNPGPVTVTAEGEVSQTRVVQEYTVLDLEPWGGFSTYAGYPGTTILFQGLGFAAEEPVTIYMHDRSSPPVAEARTDAAGNFHGAGPARIPLDATGEVRFIFVGQLTGAEASATFEVIELSVPGRGEQ